MIASVESNVFSRGLVLRNAQTQAGATHVLQAQSNYKGALTVSMWIYLPHKDHLKRPQTWFSSANLNDVDVSNFQFGLTSVDSNNQFSKLCAGNTLLSTRNSFDANQGCSAQSVPTLEWVHIAVSIDESRVIRAWINTQRQFSVLSSGKIIEYNSAKRNNGAAFQFGSLFTDENLAATCLFRHLRVHKKQLSVQEIEQEFNGVQQDAEATFDILQADGFVRNTWLFTALTSDEPRDQSTFNRELRASYDLVATPNEALTLGAQLNAPMVCEQCEIPSGSFTKSLWLRLQRLRTYDDPDTLQVMSNWDTTPDLYRTSRLYEYQQHRIEFDRLHRICAWLDSGATGEINGVSTGSSVQVCSEPLDRSFLQTWVHIGVVYDAVARQHSIFLNAMLQQTKSDQCEVPPLRFDFNQQICFDGSKLGIMSEPSDLLLVRNLVIAQGTSSARQFAAQMRLQSRTG